MTPNTSTTAGDRVVERRRAVSLARHYREAEGLSIAQIAQRLGRSSATIKAYFYDPTGEKARAVKLRYAGVCRGCGAYTQPRNGKGDAYAFCKACHPGAIERRWDPRARARGDDRVAIALREVADILRLVAHARRGGEAFKRLAEGEWPASSVVTRLFGTWAVARAAASRPNVAVPTRRPSATSGLGSNSISLPNPRESTAKSEDLRGGGAEPKRRDLQGFSVCGPDFAHNSGR
jgi:AraC-like DNA-binding protein